MAHVTDPVAELRRTLQSELRRLVAGGAEPPTRLEGDEGLFGPESVTWRLHGDGSMFVAGVRALLLQTLHPLAMAGVAQHSNFRDDPLGRLARTSQYLGVTTYGSKAAAEQMIARVQAVHASVVGAANDGRTYSAGDPHLLSWVHWALVDSVLAAHRRYGSTPLSVEDADRYVDEQNAIAERFGCDARLHGTEDLREWFAELRPELEVTRAARESVRFLLAPPLPLAARVPYGVLFSAAVTTLPWWARWSLRLPVLPLSEPLAVRPLGIAVCRTLQWAVQAPTAA
jgi:uncharacterized protein (DUF2236 family)